MAEKKHGTLEEKMEVTSEICEYVEQGYTLESACKAAGITGRTFRTWRTEISAISDSYEIARAKWKEAQRADLQQKAEQGLEKLLTGYTLRSVRYKPSTGPNGEVQTGAPVYVDTKEVGPHPAAVFFMLTNGDPASWKHRQDVRTTHLGGMPTGDLDLTNLSDEELEQYEALISKAQGGE